MKDDLRAKRTVELVCDGCGWTFWMWHDDPKLEPGKKVFCVSCLYPDRVLTKASEGDDK
jgi:hypothetical protein